MSYRSEVEKRRASYQYKMAVMRVLPDAIKTAWNLPRFRIADSIQQGRTVILVTAPAKVG